MIVSKSNSEHYRWGDNCDGWHLVKLPTFSVIQEKVPCGCKEVRHYHRKAEQFFFVLSGIASLEVDGQEKVLEAQQGILVEAGMPHQLRNNHEFELIFLVTSVPPSHGDRVEA